jgi:hypothetical protein
MMPRVPSIIGLLLMSLMLSLAGCDRSPKSGPSVMLPGKRVAELRQLTQLPHNATVHIAIDTLGNLFYVTERDDGQDAAFVVSESGIPRQTQLTAANILAAMGESVGGRGNIQDLVAGADGTIYFYFSGSKGASIRTAVGVYSRRSESITLAFNQSQLAAASGMGDSIGIARGSLVPIGSRQIGLLLRHTDGWAFLSFFTDRPGPGVDLKLGQPFKRVALDSESINLSRRQYELSAGIGGNLLLADHSTGAIWELDPLSGQTKIHTYLTALPRDVSSPLVINKDHLLLFIADSEPLEADVNITIRRQLPQTSFPALVEIAGTNFTAIGREEFRAPAGFPVYAMRIHQLLLAPDGTYIGYDLASGQLMRIRVTEEK